MGSDRWRTLLIEADEAYQAVTGACLRLAGGEVEEVSGPQFALAALERSSFDLVIWGVPSKGAPNRLEVISEIRLRTQALLLLLDGSVEIAQLDLEAGADHWLPKPFAPGALVASVRAALRRSGASVLPPALRQEIRGMLLDGGRRTLTFGGRRIAFTRQEWQLLSILISHANRFLSAREIIAAGWRAGDHEGEQLRTYVHRLRAKLAPLNLPCQLLSEHGQGYLLLFNDHPQSAASVTAVDESIEAKHGSATA